MERCELRCELRCDILRLLPDADAVVPDAVVRDDSDRAESRVTPDTMDRLLLPVTRMPPCEPPGVDGLPSSAIVSMASPS